jgi:hypothetical protein
VIDVEAQATQANNLKRHHFPDYKINIEDYISRHRRGRLSMQLTLLLTEAIGLLKQMSQLERTACLVALMAWLAERLA